MLRRIWTLVLVVLTRTALAAASYAEVIEDTSSALDGIRATQQENLSLVHSLRGFILEEAFDYEDFSGERIKKRRNLQRIVAIKDHMWRQEVITELFEMESKTMIPYSTIEAYDGSSTTSLNPRDRNATVRSGSFGAFSPAARDFGASYSFFQFGMPLCLGSVTKIEADTDPTVGRLLRLSLRTSHHPDRSVILSLAADKGCVIYAAQAFYPNGNLWLERRATEVTEVGGAWFVVKKEDAAYVYEKGERITLRERNLNEVRDLSVNPPIDNALFTVALADRTLLDDQVSGEVRVIGEELRELAESRDGSGWAIAVNVAIVAALLALLALVGWRLLASRI